MIETRITKMLGIKYPIIAGTMMNISSPEFVAACSNAGGIGILASAMYKSPEGLREAIEKTRTLTKEPFAVNVNLFPALMPTNQMDYIKVIIDEGIKVIETSGHKAPKEYVPIFKEAGAVWMHKCAGVRYARTGASLGADIIEVVGYENGGATGTLDIGTMVMIPSTVDAVDVPVAAGGGISDGRGLVAALALGAEAVVMGTRLMATKECWLHKNLKDVFVEAKETDTILVMRSVHSTHRVWNNKAAQMVLELEEKRSKPMEIYKAASGENAKKMYREGDLDVGMVSCGQGVGLIHDIPTVEELFERIIGEAKEIVGMFSRS